MITQQQLQQCLPNNPHIEHWHEALMQILPDYDITTPQRIAAFLAQCSHESNGFTALKENLNYRAATLMKVFPKYFADQSIADAYAGKQEAIANRVYANRMGNGDEHSGDGFRHCGRGLIQLTGKDNYTRFAESVEMDVNDVPEYLGTFEGAVQSACWFWESNNLNQYADVGDMVTLTKKINGGTIGLEDRLNQYHHMVQVMGG